jgi:hypothetical protein
MRLLLLHLSDVHITGWDDAVMARTDAILAAVQNLDYDLDLGVIAITGDIANSGIEDEFSIACDYLSALGSRLGSRLSTPGRAVPVRFVAIPGNHDCDFSGGDERRALLAENFLKNPGTGPDPSVVEACVAFQQPFFEFLADIAPIDRVGGVSRYDDRLYYEYRFAAGAESVRFLCCNTSWLSRLHERQGSLYFPPDAVPEGRTPDSLVIALLHHPYPWLEDESGRDLRRRLERVSDVILTGHDHDPTMRSQQGTRGQRNIYVEGGILQQAGGGGDSTFNVLLLDTAVRKQKFASFSWDGSRYLRTPSNADREPEALEWEPYQVSRLREAQRFTLTESAIAFLDDPGVPLVHRDRGTLRLQDIFIPPDFHEINYEAEYERAGEAKPRIVRGENGVDRILCTTHVLITGENQSGKTCLAKTLFLRLLDSGLVPVLIDGSGPRPPTDERVYEWLEGKSVTYYGHAAREDYRQVDRARRVVIVDNYHCFRLRAAEKRRLIANLGKFAGHIILLANELALAVDDVTHPNSRNEAAAPFVRLHIMPLSRVRRDQLIDKWLLLGARAEDTAERLAHRTVQLNQTIDALVGRNYVPPYPVYLVCVLQASEAATPIDLRASTQGYFYELFIRMALARGRDRVEYDFMAAYLAHLGYALFKEGARDVGRGRLEEIHSTYEHAHDVTRSFDRMIDLLVDQDILQATDDVYRFRYNYLYYFFVASYMRDHINEAEVRTLIRDMSQNLYIDENANIMLFLAHLSRDPIILGEMLGAASGLLAEVPAASLSGDVEFLNYAQPIAASIGYEERDPNEARRAMLEELDRQDEERGEEEAGPSAGAVDATKAAIDPILRLNAAFKTLQIIGQILKNFSMSLDATPKLDALRACYTLGLRCMTELLQSLRAIQEEPMVRVFIEVVRAHHPRLEGAELARRVSEMMVGLARIVVFSLVKHISYAVGSPDLKITYDRLLSETCTPATRLIHTSLALDHYDRAFPRAAVKDLFRDLESNAMATSILRFLVVHHFYMFPLSYRTKQAVCQDLGITYATMQAYDPGRRVIAARSE